MERSNREFRHFASVVAHDLKSPLGTIGTMSTWLIEEYGDRLDENAKEYLNYMGKAVQSMNTLVTATLQYSRVEDDLGELSEEVDSDEVLAWTLMTLSAEIKQRQAAVTSGRLPKLACREHTLVQLFQNLISNALRYGAPGSCPSIHVSAIRSATEWTFSVADNGIGIDPADTDRIFELFERVNKDGEGMGIGLSICRKFG
ncbi:MAG: sensor histidine kinase [Bryobacteraceae bacterium]